MAAKKAETKRRVQNVGVKDKEIRIGAKGKSVRQWNEKTARWEKVSRSPGSAAASMRATAQARQAVLTKESKKRTPSLTTSSPRATRSQSAGGTYTQSYARGRGIFDAIAVSNQRGREQRRIKVQKIKAKRGMK